MCEWSHGFEADDVMCITAWSRVALRRNRVPRASARPHLVAELLRDCVDDPQAQSPADFSRWAQLPFKQSHELFGLHPQALGGVCNRLSLHPFSKENRKLRRV